MKRRFRDYEYNDLLAATREALHTRDRLAKSFERSIENANAAFDANDIRKAEHACAVAVQQLRFVQREQAYAHSGIGALSHTAGRYVYREPGSSAPSEYNIDELNELDDRLTAGSADCCGLPSSASRWGKKFFSQLESACFVPFAKLRKAALAAAPKGQRAPASSPELAPKGKKGKPAAVKACRVEVELSPGCSLVED